MVLGLHCPVNYVNCNQLFGVVVQVIINKYWYRFLNNWFKNYILFKNSTTARFSHFYFFTFSFFWMLPFLGIFDICSKLLCKFELFTFFNSSPFQNKYSSQSGRIIRHRCSVKEFLDCSTNLIFSSNLPVPLTL